LAKNPHGYCHVDLNLVKKEDRKAWSSVLEKSS
jgi:hypothetical protein